MYSIILTNNTITLIVMYHKFMINRLFNNIKDNILCNKVIINIFG